MIYSLSQRTMSANKRDTSGSTNGSPLVSLFYSTNICDSILVFCCIYRNLSIYHKCCIYRDRGSKATTKASEYIVKEIGILTLQSH